MILKNVTLPAIVLANLYQRTLADVRDYLGGNNKNILVLVNFSNSRFLPYAELIFLSGILRACKLSLDDVAIVNLSDQNTNDFTLVSERLKPEIVISSGIDFSVLDLPFNIPSFQLQLYKQKKYVHVPSLATIEKDDVLKRKLWELLKVLF